MKDYLRIRPCELSRGDFEGSLNYRRHLSYNNDHTILSYIE